MPQYAGRVGYRRIADDLKEKIENGFYPVGETLPSFGSLASQYGVKEGVARNAVYALRDEGIIDVEAGKGSVVVHKPSEAPPSERDQLMQQIASMRARIEQVAGEVAELRREVREGQQPPAPARQGSRPASQARP